MSTSDYNYSDYTPLDNTGSSYSVFKSAFKNIRFALPVSGQYMVTHPDMANLVGISYKLYADVSLWRALLAFNGIQDPIQDVQPGVLLNYPTKSAIIAYISAQQNNKTTTITI